MDCIAKRPRTFQTNPIAEGLNIYRAGGWRGQLERTRRWHNRLRRASAGDYADYLYTFFQNCYQLRDWVNLDLKGGQRRADDLFASTLELRLCRDICTALKHLDLHRPPRVPAGFADGHEYRPEGWPTDHAGLPIFFIASGQKFDSLDLADRNMEAWNRFADELGLQSGPGEEATPT